MRRLNFTILHETKKKKEGKNNSKLSLSMYKFTRPEGGCSTRNRVDERWVRRKSGKSKNQQREPTGQRSAKREMVDEGNAGNH